MAFTVKFYTVSDDARVVSKTLGTPTEYTNVVIKETTNVLAPTIRVARSSNMSGYNYCYIERYGRYYFITAIETTPDGMWVISCRCDVLMSYKSQIKALTGTLERSEKNFNGYLNDSQYKAYAYRKIVTKQFPTAINDDHYILMTVG